MKGSRISCISNYYGWIEVDRVDDCGDHLRSNIYDWSGICGAKVDSNRRVQERLYKAILATAKYPERFAEESKPWRFMFFPVCDHDYRRSE